MKKYYLIFICFLVVGEFVNSQAFFENQATALGVGLSSGDTNFGSGISFCDFDNDGWDDITLATDSSQPARFFKNNNGTYTEVFFNITLINSHGKQVVWADYDNDGDKDLYVASDVSGNQLYRNDGNSNFINVTSSAGLPTTNVYTYGAVWGDYNNDGYLDLFLANKDFTFNLPNYLYKNNGDGTFTDKSAEAGILTTSNLSLCATFFDYNNDGWQDIYVSNDRDFNTNVLYKNNGDGTFEDVSSFSNTDVAINAMTTTIGDYNNDGWFDIYVTNPQGGNVFFENNGDGTFTDLAPTNGTLFSSVGWGSVFFDAENDTHLDLYVSGSPDGSGSFLPAAFYNNNGSGLFSIPNNAGFVGDTSESFSNAIGDIDNNGLADIIVNNSNNDEMFIWKNQSNTTNNWLKLKLDGVQSNKDGIGSVIEISINGNKQYRYTGCGEGYLAQNSSTEFFGLGTATSVDYIKVTWLSGVVDTFNNITANQTIIIEENSDTLNVLETNFSKFILYPNPVKDKLVITTQDIIKNLEIYSILGQKVLSSNSGLNNKETVVDMSKLQNGLYLIKIKTNTISKVIRIIKN